MTVTATLPYYTKQALIERCAKDERSPVDAVRVIDVKPGNGRHVHSDQCGYKEGNRLSCMKDCDDSDTIVELAYRCPEGDNCYTASRGVHEHHALYGIVDGEFRLWAD